MRILKQDPMVAAQGGAMKVSMMADMGQPDDEGEGSYPNDGGAANLDVRSQGLSPST